MKFNLIHRCLVSTLPVLLLVQLTASAATPTTGGAGIAVSCDHRYISQRDAARVMKTDKFSQDLPQPPILYANLARQRHRSMDQVLSTLTPPETQPRTVAAR